MNIIDAHLTYLTCCPYNWIGDRYIRIVNYRYPYIPGLGGGMINRKRGEEEDEWNAILNRLDRIKREMELLDQQRRCNH